MTVSGSAGSLRQQLQDAAHDAVVAWEVEAWGGEGSSTDAEDAFNAALTAVILDAIWPLVSEAVAAAEVRVAEEIGEAIEATEYPHPFSSPRDELVCKLATQEAAKRARAARSVPGTEKP